MRSDTSGIREQEVPPGQLLGAIFSASPDAVVVVDDAATIVLSSPGVTQLFGYYPEELVGEPIAVLIPMERRDVHAGHMADFFASPHPRQMGAGLELAGLQRGGARIAVDVSLAPVEVRGRRYVAAFVRDARERKRGVDRLHAVHEITQQLLAGSRVNDVLPFISSSARALTSSDLAVVVLPGPRPDTFRIAAADGIGASDLVGVEFEADEQTAKVVQNREAQLVEGLVGDTGLAAALCEVGLDSALFVPLSATSRSLGLLGLLRSSSLSFGTVDVAFAEVFASAVATALELGEARAELARMEILSEDERIARDLHDTIIQQLFAIGMSLQAARGMISGPGIERIDDAVSDLDLVVRDIRNMIFGLPGRSAEARGLREQMLALADRFRPELGFLPRVAFSGPVDSVIPDAVADHLLQVVNEALSNVARHAGASLANVVVSIEANVLSLFVVDDGIGIPAGPSAGLGLANMRDRAANLQGSLVIKAREPHGTILEWSVPLG